MKTVRLKKTDNWLLSLRQRLGLSQERMARQLKMSETAFRMAEQGRRSLPTMALIQLVQLEVKLGETGALPPEGPHPAEQESLSKCRQSYASLFAKEAQCRLRSRKLFTKLDMMQKLYGKTREWLQVIENAMEENAEDPSMVEWWRRQQQSAIRTLNRCSLPAQVLLQSRISLLNAETELYKNMQEQLKQDLPEFFLETNNQNGEAH